jgi:hypothetical protein
VDDGISTTPGVKRCPACEGRTATAPGPCPACGRRYRRDASSARSSIRMDDPRWRIEAAWRALAVASAVPVAIALPDFKVANSVPLLALLVPALTRTACMAWRRQTYPVIHPAAYLVLASIVSYFVTFMTLGMAIGIAAIASLSGPVWVTLLPPWIWFALFVVFHLLLWPWQRNPTAEDRQPSHPPGDPEN